MDFFHIDAKNEKIERLLAFAPVMPRRIRGCRRSSSWGSPCLARYAGTPMILLFQSDLVITVQMVRLIAIKNILKFNLPPLYGQTVIVVEVIDDRLVIHDGITDDIGFISTQGSYQNLSVFLVVDLTKDGQFAAVPVKRTPQPYRATLPLYDCLIFC